MKRRYSFRFWLTVVALLLPLSLIAQVIFKSGFESADPSSIPPEITEFALAVSTSPDNAQLAWLEGSDNLTASSGLAYLLHYSTQAGFTPDGTTLYDEYIGETSTEVTGLSAATEYFFRLSARDADGNESAFIDEIGVTTAAENTLIFGDADWAIAEEDLFLGPLLSITDTQLVFTLLPESILPETGQILVGDDEQEQGYLRRVLSVGTPSGGQLTVTTESAALADIVEATTIDSTLKLFDVVEQEGSRVEQTAQGSVQARNRQVWKDRLLIAEQVDHIPRKGFISSTNKTPTASKDADTGTTNASVVTEDDELQVSHPSGDSTKAGERVRFEVEALVQAIFDASGEPDWDIILFVFSGMTHPSHSSNNNFGASFTESGSVTSAGGLRTVRTGQFTWNTVESDADAAVYTARFSATAEKQNCNPAVFQYLICHRTVEIEVDISVGPQGRYVVTSAASEEMGVSVDLDFAPELLTHIELGILGLKNAAVHMRGAAVFDALAYYRFQGTSTLDVLKPVFTRTYRSVYTVGPVPVYQEVILTAAIHFTADALLAIEANAEARLEFDFDLGARYTRAGGWVDINEYNTTQSITLDLGVQGAVNAEIRLIPNIEVRFYRVASAGFSLEPYLEGHLEAEFIAEADLLNLDSFGQYRMTRLDAGLGLEGKIYARLKVLHKPALSYPSTGEKTLFDLKFPIFSLPELSVQALTSPVIACQPAIIQGSATDGANNPFDETSILWKAYPTDAAIFASDADPLDAEFVAPSAGDYKLFFIGKGEALGNIARQFEILDVTVQEGSGDCPTLTVTKTGSGSGAVTSQPAGINCGFSCSYSFEIDQAVTLNAQPEANSGFVGWSGAGCTGTGACNLTLDASKSVTAMFDLNIDELVEIDTPSNSITVPEGGTASFQVRLTSQPNSDVTISVAHIGGDVDLSVQSGSNLVFTTDDWNQYQLVTLAAAGDADDVDGVATIQLSITGLNPAIVIATEQDVDIPEPPDCGIAENGQEAWAALGSAVAVSGINSIPEIVPVDGSVMSLLRTNGNMRASDAEMENAFAIPSGSLDTLISGNATLGSACYRTINAAIGDTIEFSWNFIAGSASGRDFAFAVVDGQAQLLLDVFGVNFSTSNQFFKQSGWRTFRHTFTQAGPQIIAVGAIDENTFFGAHLLTVDQFNFIPASP